MQNACEELKQNVKNLSKIKCASIFHICGESDKKTKIVLKAGYSPEDFEIFMNLLNFDYDSGYGSQELFGTVWFKNGTWLERQEYDGSEAWSYKKCPKIPKKCL